MKTLKDIVGRRFLPARAVFMLAGVLLLGACATQRLPKLAVPPLHHSGPEVQVPDVDVLALSPAMEEFLKHYILKYRDLHTRMYLLMNSISGNGVLGFDYDESLTLTSTEAFEARSGNCIGFANMIVALARRSGLKAYYQEIIRQPEYFSRENTVMLVKHINVVLEAPGYTYVVDISGIKLNPIMRRRIVTDDFAKALYLNNIGAEALLANDLPTAYAYMLKAIDIVPLMTDSWVNVGVVFGRNDQLNEAETALQRALQIDASEFSAMSNLYDIYLAQGDTESAAELQAQVEKHRSSNPYYLLKQSDEALAQDRFDESISLLRRAIRKKSGDHMLYFALAKTQYLSGEISAAQDSLMRAREFAPENMMAYYARPLKELVTEE